MQHLIGSGLHQQKEPALCSPGSRGGHGQYLQAAYDLPERQSTLIPPDESGGGQPEHLVQVRLIQTIEPYISHHAPGGREGGRGVEKTLKTQRMQVGAHTMQSS